MWLVTQAETGLTASASREHQGGLATTQSPERHKAALPSGHPAEANLAGAPWLWTSGLKNTKRRKFCCFQPLTLWCFVMAG